MSKEDKASAQTANDMAGRRHRESATVHSIPDQIPSELNVDANCYRGSLREDLRPATAPPSSGASEPERPEFAREAAQVDSVTAIASSPAIAGSLADEGSRPHGGPRTVAGKANSRRNALRHGLTAKTLMDEVLPTGRVSALRNELLSELAPRSAIERMLVDEIARHGAMLEIGEQAELAVLRRSAKELAAMHHDETIADADERKESLLATAVASDAVEKFCRYRRGHEKAVISAIKTLIELDDLGRSASKPRPEPSPAAPPRRRTKDECEVWLLRLAEQGLARCPGCGHNASNWLQERRFLQCKRCRRQYSLRSGTVMAHSRLPLATWFNAIEEILANPAITAAELARRVRIRRNATAQEMHKNILAAMRARDAEQQLAGLSRPV